jgi:hypothetical protein
MNKKLLLLIFFQVTSQILFSQYNDPNIPKPASGYGADGSHVPAVISFANPAFPTNTIQIYYPSDIIGKVPTIFYSHAFGGNNSANISGMLNFVASKGYAVVFVPYQTIGPTVEQRYSNLLNGFRKAARDYPNIIDTTRVGFMGHSFGGGASFANAYKCFTENNWGSQGRFIYALAQWYAYNISQTELRAFPADTKLLTEIFDDDSTNDHRLAIDIFNNINISPDEKDCLLLKSDTINNYIYVADHVVPNNNAFNAYDYYAYYRFIDALCDYTFNGNMAAKAVALGNGAASQIQMPGGLKPLVQYDYPLVLYPESKYQFTCSDSQNPRLGQCPSNTFTFTRNGNWDEPDNWLNRAMPPASLSGNMFIIINPIAGGECILNVPQLIGASTQLIVNSNKKLTINGNLVIVK